MVKLGRIRHVEAAKYKCTLELGKNSLADADVVSFIEAVIEERLLGRKRFKKSRKPIMELNFNAAGTEVTIYASAT
jgi:hypothetical protein